MRLKKVLCIVMTAVMVFGATGCSSKDKTNNGSTSTSNGTEAGETNFSGKTLKLAVAETAYGRAVWEKVCAGFEKVSGAKVELTIDKKIDDIISPQMKSGEFPDVIMKAVGSETALTETFVKDNNMADLSDVLTMTVPGETSTVKDKLIPGFVENSITQPYGDGKTYLMPMFYSPCGLFYNQALFESEGFTVPTTWDEMFALGDKAKEKGISLFAYPTTGYFDAFFYSLLHETMAGTDNFAKAMRYENGIWDTKEAKQAFDIVAKLAQYTDPTTPANATDQDYKKNQQLILDNKALFMPNGTWVIDEMKDAQRADGFEWGFTALPAVKEGGERASYSFFEQIWMPKKAENQALGKYFMSYLYSDEAADIFATQGDAVAVQPIKGMTDKLTGNNKLFYSIYENGAVAVIDAFKATDPVEGITVRTTFFDPINSLVSGDKTQEQWVNQIKEDSEKLNAALK